jgi:surface polysaccharide O-acyltransferase-like enzyme
MHSQGSIHKVNPERGLLFVDNVRFLSMLAIVSIHCWEVVGYVGTSTPLMTDAVWTPLKFGTIGFFLISGFLLGDRLKIVNSLEYLRRRIRRVFVPWGVWYLLYCVACVVQFHHDYKIQYRGGAEEFRLVGQQMYLCLFESAFWFVPNLLLGICVLLACRRYLYHWGLGVVLLAIDLFYVVNIYKRWVPSLHSEALLGFVFYLWLGSYVAAYRQRMLGWVARVPMSAMLGATAMAALVAFGEARVLKGRAVDPMNTLRLSNQVFSVLCVLTLVKLPRPLWPRLLKVRRETFGIYLTHMMVLVIALRVVRRLLHDGGWWLTSQGLLFLLWLIVAAATYVVSVGLTRMLAASRTTRWTVGVEGEMPEVLDDARRVVPTSLVG